MRVLVNFLPLLGRGGGRQNALNLWAELARQGGAGHGWLAVARPNLGLEPPGGGTGMEVHTLAVEGRGVGGGRFRAENVELPRLAARFGADVIFTPMGTGPLRSALPRVAGWHDSTALYLDSPMWRGASARELAPQRMRAAYAAVALRGAARVCVQTATMGRRVAAQLGVDPGRIRLVPNGLSTFLARESPAPPASTTPRRILVVTTTQPAKNLPILPRIARALGEMGVEGVEIVATLDPVEGAEAMGLVVGGRSDGVVRGGRIPVRCVGAVPHEALGDLYRSAAAVLVPSWVESFTAVYPEAWHFGVPVVTSDLDFARDLCRDAALYAPPEHPRLFADRLLRVLQDGAIRDELIGRGRARLGALPTWADRIALYLSALEEAVQLA